MTGVIFNQPGFVDEAGHLSDPTLTTADAWTVVLGAHMDDQFGLDIHGGGAVQIVAPVAELAAGRLDRLVCSVDAS